MRLKKTIAVAMTSALVLGIMAAPAAKLQTEAEGRTGVYTNNQATGISGVSIQTPQETTKLYAGLSWEAMEQDIGVRLNVTDEVCGPAAKWSLTNAAALLGATEVKTLGMDLEKYARNSGWTEDILEANGRIRVCIGLPAGSDPTRDYAVLSLKQGGSVEVLGDLDLNPATVTVDSDCFSTFMIVSAPAGTFNAYRVANPNALDEMACPVYVKGIDSTIHVDVDRDRGTVYSAGVLTDAGAVWAAAGGRNVWLNMREVSPGVVARYSLDSTIRLTNASNKKLPESEKMTEDEKIKEASKYSYYEIGLDAGVERVTNTNGKLRLTITIPQDYPIYADYAVAVLNMDGTVSILKDIDANPSTVTVDTDQFRVYVFLWGKKGAFDVQPY